ncbi:MAG: UDP-N-acetylmuramate--L-alanine ligase, partial [Clostridia bacterium]|nr:UDP-N-acetylmuramate--L-alanine ligase [Clostridia bacterium]
LADLVVLTDVYAAREERIAGGTSQELAAALGKRAVYFPSPEAASLYVRSIAKEGDVVAVMGAGDLSARVFCGVLSFGEG